MKLLIGLILAVFVGIGCRWFGIPLPGPPAIMGAAMAVAMASGYTATDYWLSRKSASTSATSINRTDQGRTEKGSQRVTTTALLRDQDGSGM
jgi:XapX domain-containing protein